MWFRAMLKALRSGFRRRTRRSPPGQPPPKLAVEVLEDRTVPAFLTAVNYSVGSFPQAIAVGHFDAGDTLDLVVANHNSSTISILLGNANGTFQAAQSYATGNGPLSVAVGDLDGQPGDDIVTANVFDLSVLLNNGDGTFQDPQSLSTGSYPLSVAVGDLDGNGKMDLGVTSFLYYGGSYGGFYQGFAQVLLGDGTGSFATTSFNFLNAPFPLGATAADLDGDLDDDLVTANRDSNTLSVLLSDGNGDFSSITDYFAGSGPASVAVGDLDGQGGLDLVTANSFGSNVSVLKGNGTGGFGPAQTFATGSSPNSVALGDFNDDGVADLVTANPGGGSVSVLIGKGNGTFNVAQNTSVGSSPLSVAVGDFNGDGKDDAATANAGSSGTVSVLLNAGNFPAANAPSITIGDMTISEGNLGPKVISLTVTLSTAPTETIEVSYATANESATTADGDYVGKTGMLTFSPGGPLTQNIEVTINGDRRGEPNETFVVNLSGAPNAFLTDPQAVVTITDDEPRLIISNASITEGNRGTKLMTFTVTLSFAYDAPVTVNFATRDGTGMVANNDYVAKSGPITFLPDQPLTQTITITINGDRQKEPNETLFVDLSNASGALILDAEGVGTITNDDKGNGKGKGKPNR